MKKIGFAVDLGTTTIDYYLMDIATSKIIAAASFPNPQALYGSDVINRILTITRDKAYAVILKNKLVDALNMHFLNTLKQYNYKTDDVNRICICGNTTMISILLELDVSCLGKAPFLPKLSDSVVIAADKLFGAGNPFTCQVFLSGCAGAFIGGDILAGIYYLKNKFPGEAFCKRNCMLIDLGTNGEMVLFANGRYYAASTACGPAFEGCTRRQKVYGSTVIEAIALCVALHKVLPDGSFAQEGINQLTFNQITLNADILHDILLAKAAIAAGITVLCDQADISLTAVDDVYIAGGFGFYLNITHAINIGLFPQAFKQKIKIVGNTSLGGAKIILCEDTVNLNTDIINVYNFAEIPDYQDNFIQNMFFRPF